MDEQALRGLIADVKTGKLSRRDFTRQMIALGLTAPLALGALPNPAAGETRLVFTLDREVEVRLTIFDLSGRRIAAPFAGRLPPGRHTIDWRLTDARGARVPAGAYFARLEGLGRSSLARVIVSGP